MSDLSHRANIRVAPERPGVKQAYVDPFPQVMGTGMRGGAKAWFKA